MTSITSPQKSRIVGSLACQQNSYLRELDTEIISCIESQSSLLTDKEKLNSNDKKEWLIECADSVLFPEGGGQPCDHGTLIDLSNPESSPIQIINIQRDGLKCILQSPVPIPPGTKVRQTLDFERRLDHMQQHTGQHLLSAILDTCPEQETMGWGMGPDGGMNYVDMKRKVTDAEVADVQNRCNAAIREGITISVLGMAEAIDAEKGVMRRIKIGELDENPCCGTHLPSLSPLQILLLHNQYPVHTTQSRLFFSVGTRAINLSSTAVNSLRAVGQHINSPHTLKGITERFDKLSEQNSEARGLSKALSKELAEALAGEIRARFQVAEEKGTKRIMVGMHSAAQGMDVLNAVSALTRDLFEVKSDGSVERALVFCSGDVGKVGVVSIVGNNDDLVKDCVKSVTEILPHVKGGGKGLRWQGKVLTWSTEDVQKIRQYFLHLYPKNLFISSS